MSTLYFSFRISSPICFLFFWNLSSVKFFYFVESDKDDFVHCLTFIGYCVCLSVNVCLRMNVCVCVCVLFLMLCYLYYILLKFLSTSLLFFSSDSNDLFSFFLSLLLFIYRDVMETYKEKASQLFDTLMDDVRRNAVYSLFIYKPAPNTQP